MTRTHRRIAWSVFAATLAVFLSSLSRLVWISPANDLQVELAYGALRVWSTSPGAVMGSPGYKFGGGWTGLGHVVPRFERNIAVWTVGSQVGASGMTRRAVGDVAIIPTWWPLVLAALWVGAPPLWSRWRGPRPGHCPGCGYDRRGSPGACPECGSTDPAARVAAPDLLPSAMGI